MTPDRRRRILIVLLFLATSAGGTSHALFTGKTLAPTQIVALGAPYRELEPVEYRTGNLNQNDQAEQLALVAAFYKNLRGGRFDLWTSNQATGLPMFTAVYNRILAPWNIAYLFVPLWFAPTLAVFLALFVCQLGTYGLARRIGIGMPGALFAAVAYTFSGSVVTSTNRIHEIFLFPLLLYAVHGAATSAARRGRFLALAAAATTFTLVAGFPEVAVVSFGVAVVWLAYLAVPHFRQRDERRRNIEAAVAMTCGLAIALSVLLPSLEYLRAGDSLDRTFGRETRVQTIMLATSISGRLFGNPGYGETWAASRVTNGFEGNSTLGVVALALLLFVFVAGRSTAARGTEPGAHVARFFLPVAVFAMGAIYWGGPFTAVTGRLPFGGVIILGRLRFLIALAIAIAAAGGLDALVRRERTRASIPHRLMTGVLLGGIAGGGVEALMFAARQNHISSLVAGAAVRVTLGVAALLLALVVRVGWAQTLIVVIAVAVELQWGLWDFTPASPRRHFYRDLASFRPLEESARESNRFVGVGFSVLRPHTSAVIGLNDLRTAFPVVARYADLMNLAEPRAYKSTFKSAFTAKLEPGSPVLDRLAVHYYAVGAGSVPFEPGDRANVPARAGAPLPATFRLALPAGGVRAVGIGLRTGGCARGWVEASIDGVVSRRLVRDVRERTWFPFFDLGFNARSVNMTFRSTHCPMTISDPVITAVGPLPGGTLSLVDARGWALYQRATALPRVTLAERAVRVDEQDGRLRMLAEKMDPNDVILETGPAEQRYGGGDARITEDAGDRLVVRTESRGAGLLVVRDVNAPGWRARVNGRPAAILFADHAFRAVRIPAGSSTVTFTYLPRTFVIGLAAAAAGIMALAFLMMSSRRRSSTGNDVASRMSP